MLALLSGVFLGWSLGANDAANVFGTAVSSRMVRFRTAAILIAVFVVVGALVSGRAAIQTLQGLTSLNLQQAVLASVAAAVCVSAMTLLGLPVSTSQAVIGGILGIGLLNRRMDLSGLGTVVACWVATPVGAALFAIILYHVLAWCHNRLRLSLFQSDRLLRMGMIVSGIYGAYSLGANNVANVTAVFVGAGLIDMLTATAVGGASIALGALTFSRPVMETVGKRLVRLDPFSALTVVLALAVTVHLFTLVGVPVSTSQAVVGAVVGIGLVKGASTVKPRTLMHILLAWVLTPAAACLIVLVLHVGLHLRYVPAS